MCLCRARLLLAFALTITTFSFLLPAERAAAAAAPMRVVYGFDREYAPFSYEDPGGKPVGFDVEIMEAIFKGKTQLFMRPLNWSGIQVELASGNITVATSMVRTPARARSFGYSKLPLFDLKLRFFTKTYKRVANPSFLRGQAVAVEEGSLQKALLDQFGGINVKTFKSRNLALRALYNDEVDAYCGPDEPSYYVIRKLNYGAITTLGSPLGVTEMYIAVNKDRGDVLRMVNDGLTELYASGEYNRIYRKWFITELDAAEQAEMLKACKAVMPSSYSPYSKLAKAAAVITATGKVFAGANIESADPKVSISALEAAVSRALLNGEQEIRAAITVDHNNKVVKPSEEECQLLYEFGRGVLVVYPAPNGKGNITPMVVEIMKNPVSLKVFHIN